MRRQDLTHQRDPQLRLSRGDVCRSLADIRLENRLGFNAVHDSEIENHLLDVDPAGAILDVRDRLCVQQSLFQCFGCADVGFVPPVRMPMPMPARAISTRPPPASLPSLIRSSIAAVVTMARSNGSPAFIFLRRPAVE